MASGDDVFIEEQRTLLPQTVFVQTKRAYGQHSGTSMSPAQACQAIRSGVASALGQQASLQPLVLNGTISVQIQTTTPAMADLFCQWPSLQRLDGDEIAFEAPSVEAAVRMINSLSAMSTMLR
jgi:D-amino peptidase